ncbi:Glutaredoxin-2 [Leclercia adecarboxylata]|uniref:Glutaredoxin-2 n=1 Tax=Leclercia adecarboxylata TaxID=83655 RepID=A0A4U9HW98_9ENTR|nr:Glutaredoxin-2 [Leclercia adecarboxylata]
MKLYVYEHCPFCIRARMIFGLKKVPFELGRDYGGRCRNANPYGG